MELALDNFRELVTVCIDNRLYQLVFYNKTWPYWQTISITDEKLARVAFGIISIQSR